MVTYDVIVVGAGPAGSAAAEKCARFGLKTILLEKEKLPRDKPCGGMFCPSIRDVVGIYGSSVEDIVERNTDSMKIYFDGEIVLEKRYPAFLFSRDKFDYFITKKAIESGATVVDECRVSDVVIDGSKVKVTSDKGVFVSKIVIGADGVNSVVAKKTGLNEGFGMDEAALAIETEIKMSNKEIERRYGNCAILYAHHNFVGYEWVFPKNGCVNVGLGTKVSKSAKLRERFSEMLERLDLKADVVKAHMIPLKLLEKPYSERVILAGDAGGFVFPLVGAGIWPAIISGRAAADVCYDAVRKDDYSEKIFAKYLFVCRDIRRDIKTCDMQLKFVELCMKYRILNPVIAKNFLKFIDETEKYI